MATITATEETTMTIEMLTAEYEKAHKAYRKAERADRKSPLGCYDTRKAANEAHAAYCAAMSALTAATK